MDTQDGRPRALLLDFGGVVLRCGHEQMAVALGDDPAFAGVLARRGAHGSERDELWERMLAQEISEREYWMARAEETGAALGERWDVQRFMRVLHPQPSYDLLNPGALRLIADARRAHVKVGVLTNDLAAFNPPSWVEQMEVLHEVDTVVDGSITGVLKPDPQAYRLAAEALRVAPEQVLFLDDMPWNVRGAQTVGMTALQVDLRHPDAAFDRARRLLGLYDRIMEP